MSDKPTLDYCSYFRCAYNDRTNCTAKEVSLRWEVVKGQDVLICRTKVLKPKEEGEKNEAP